MSEIEPTLEGDRMSEELKEIETTEAVEAVEVAEVVEVDVREVTGGVEERRSWSLDASPVNEESRTVQIAVSSEEPVERSFGNEVLEHTEEAIDLSFLASGRAPLLLDHDPEQQIGVIESVDLDSSARRLRATVRFGRNGLVKKSSMMLSMASELTLALATLSTKWFAKVTITSLNLGDLWKQASFQFPLM